LFLDTPVARPHRLFNSAETGSRRGLDVTGSKKPAPDGFIVAGDVVAIINYINARSSGKIPVNGPYGPPYVDVTGDDQVVAGDVIEIINYINAHPGRREAEATAARQLESNTPPSDLITLLALDIAEQASRRRRLR
jgi:hypothetical protein